MGSSRGSVRLRRAMRHPVTAVTLVFVVFTHGVAGWAEQIRQCPRAGSAVARQILLLQVLVVLVVVVGAVALAYADARRYPDAAAARTGRWPWRSRWPTPRRCAAALRTADPSRTHPAVRRGRYAGTPAPTSWW